MSAARPAIVAVVIIVGLAAIPLFWQESKASKMRGEFGALEERRTTAAAAIAEYEAGTGAHSSSSMSNTRTVRDLIEHSEKRVDVEEMMESIMKVMMSQDIVGMLKIFLPISNLNREEYDRLLAELEEHEGNEQSKMMVMQMMMMFAPSDDPAAGLERMIKLDVEPYSYANMLRQWASDDPVAALAWYREKLDAGELDGKSIENRAEKYLLAELIGGTAQKDAKLGVDLLIESIAAGSNEAHNAVSRLAGSLGAEFKKTGDDAQLKRLFAWDTDNRYRDQIVRSAMRSALRDGEFAEVTRFAEAYLDDPEAQRSTVISQVSNQRNQPIADRAEFLIGYLPEDRAPAAIRELTNSGYSWNSIDPDTQEWVEAQPAGPVRDAGLQGLTDSLQIHQSFEEAYEIAQGIGDEALRDQTIVDLGRGWIRVDKEAAIATLPPAAVEVIESGQPEQNVRTRTTFSTGPSGGTIETTEAPVE